MSLLFCQRSESHRRRTAAILVCVLVAMSVAMTLAMLSLRSVIITRQAMRHDLQLEQTRWLLDAARQRAALAFLRDADYAGEVWTVTDALPDFATARAEIKVERPELSPVQLSVSVMLQRPGDVSLPTRRSGTWPAPSLSPN